MCFDKYFNCGDFGWFACGKNNNNSRQPSRISTIPCNFSAFASKAATNAVIVGTPVIIYNFLLAVRSERHFRIFAN